MNEPTELEKLVTLLSTESAETEITFREESTRDIRYTLVIGTEDNPLLLKLARIFGCPAKDLPWARNKRFEACDDWHGRGKVNLRELADELIVIHGEFFDFQLTLAELRLLALGADVTLRC